MAGRNRVIARIPRDVRQRQRGEARAAHAPPPGRFMTSDPLWRRDGRQPFYGLGDQMSACCGSHDSRTL